MSKKEKNARVEPKNPQSRGEACLNRERVSTPEEAKCSISLTLGFFVRIIMARAGVAELADAHG